MLRQVVGMSAVLAAAQPAAAAGVDVEFVDEVGVQRRGSHRPRRQLPADRGPDPAARLTVLGAPRPTRTGPNPLSS